MKKLLLITCTVLGSIYATAQTTAPNFNINDCASTNHDLYSELNSGKVVVIAFVMPCGSCIGPALSAYNEVLNYATSNPGRVVFYLSDDLGTTSCTTLTNWANTNGMTGIPVFSNTALKESDYGSGGMPKIVVVAGSTHEVIFTQNGGLNVANFDNAIDQGLVAGIFESSKADFKLLLFPNPSTLNKTTISYNLTTAADVTVEVYNTLGAKVKSLSLEKQAAGKHEEMIDFSALENGIYFCKLNAGESSQVLKFTVSH